MTSIESSKEILFFTRHKAKVQSIVAELKRLRELEDSRKKECLRLMEELNEAKVQQRDLRRELASKQPEDVTFVKESYDDELKKRDKKVGELQVEIEDLKRLNEENQEVIQRQSMQIYEHEQIVKEHESKKQREGNSKSADQHRLMNLFESKYNSVKSKLDEAYVKLNEIERDRMHVKDVHTMLQREHNRLRYLLEEKIQDVELYGKQLESHRREQAEDKKESMELKLHLERCKAALDVAQCKWKSAVQTSEKLLGERSELLASLNASESEKHSLHSQIAQEQRIIDSLRSENMKLSKRLEGKAVAGTDSVGDSILENMNNPQFSTVENRVEIVTPTAAWSTYLDADMLSTPCGITTISDFPTDTVMGSASLIGTSKTEECQRVESTMDLSNSKTIRRDISESSETFSEPSQLSVVNSVGKQSRLSSDSLSDGASTVASQGRQSVDLCPDLQNSPDRCSRISTPTGRARILTPTGQLRLTDKSQTPLSADSNDLVGLRKCPVAGTLDPEKPPIKTVSLSTETPLPAALTPRILYGASNKHENSTELNKNHEVYSAINCETMDLATRVETSLSEATIHSSMLSLEKGALQEIKASPLLSYTGSNATSPTIDTFPIAGISQFPNMSVHSLSPDTTMQFSEDMKLVGQLESEGLEALEISGHSGSSSIPAAAEQATDKCTQEREAFAKLSLADALATFFSQ